MTSALARMLARSPPPPLLPAQVQALISGCTAFFHPASLAWITTQQFEWGVGLLMLAMGLSLTKEDFKRVRQTGGLTPLNRASTGSLC